MRTSNKPMRYITLALAFCCAGDALIAQTSGKQSAAPPYNPPTVYTPTKMNLYTSYCGLWRTDQTYASTIRLSNQLSISPIDATVTLFMKDGAPYILAPVHLQTSGVSTVNINSALSSAPASIQPHLSTFGSASVSYRYDWQGVVFASMSIMDTVRSLEYTYPFMFPMAEQMGASASVPAGATNSTTFEGLHWGYSAQSSVFLSFSNTTQRPLNVSMSLLDSNGNITVGESLVIPSLNTALLTGLPTSAKPGGVQVTWNGDEDALAVLGGIEDAKYGYSENIPFSAVPVSGPADLSTIQMTYASPGIMVGAQDPMMGFPTNLAFQPYGYFRNISGQLMKLSGQIFYTKGGQSGSLPLPPTTLPAHSSLSLPLQSAIQGLGLNGAITLVFSYSGQAGALLASTGSVDTTGNYVFAVPAHPSGESAGKTSVFWTTANGFDTMYSIWNPASQAQPLLATFQLGNGQTYLYPVTVPASGTVMIDVKEIAEMGTPDINGNALPLSVTQGRVSFSAASGRPVDPVNVVISGGIYNPAKAVCGYTCETCDGCTIVQIAPTPADGTVGVLMQLYAQCPWTTGTLYDYTESSTWSSGNPSVVQFESPGLANPLSPGSTTDSAQMPSLPVSMGQICTEGSLPPCQYGTPVAGGSVFFPQVTINSVSLVSNQISTTLAPSSGAGSFSLWEADSGGPTNYSQTGASRGSGTYTDSFNTTTSSPVGQYGTIYASWNVSVVTAVASYNYDFYNYGNTHQSQYTLINEGTCSGGSSTAYIITNQSACFASGLLTTTLNGTFESMTALNGTGQSNSYGLLKALAASSCAYATTGKPAGANNSNTFMEVSSVTGACNTALSTSTVAQFNHWCGVQIFLEGYGSPGTEKTVADECNRCGSDPPHFDNWTPNGGSNCSKDVSDLGSGFYVTEEVQQ